MSLTNVDTLKLTSAFSHKNFFKTSFYKEVIYGNLTRGGGFVLLAILDHVTAKRAGAREGGLLAVCKQHGASRSGLESYHSSDKVGVGKLTTSYI